MRWIALALSTMFFCGCGAKASMSGGSAKSEASDDRSSATSGCNDCESNESSTECSECEAEVQDENAANGSEDPTNTSVNEPSTASANGPTSADALACTAAVGGEVDQTISIEHGDFDTAITEGAVVLLQCTGQAQIDLNPADVRRLKGLCLWSAGGATIELSTDLEVENFFYYGRGNANSTITVIGDGAIDHLVTDLSGQHHLTVSGPNVACDSLDVVNGGSSSFNCLRQ